MILERFRMSAEYQQLETVYPLLAESRIVQLIVYVHNLADSRSFYADQLGLRIIEQDSQSVKFDVGKSILCLNEASAHNLTLSSKRDDSSDTVFLVDDLEGMCAALGKRGVVFARYRTYEIGAVVDFYDPNGHRLMLFQPSEKSMKSPSSDKLRAVWRSCGRGGTELIGPAAESIVASVKDLEEWGLDGKPLIYFFVFIKDRREAIDFYETRLGLRVLERTHCCNEECPSEEKGVVKYDGGGLILSTHHLHGHYAVLDDHGNPYGADEFEPELAKGVAPVFHVTDLDEAIQDSAKRGLQFSYVALNSLPGITARFEAPSGHLYYLYQPSPEAFAGPGGAKLEHILAAEV